jgi:ABC-type branched-subunit amino acid transport system substrate-binding protein
LVSILSSTRLFGDNEAGANATRLVFQDKIHYLIGGSIAATGMAVLPITQTAKVVTSSVWWGK